MGRFHVREALVLAGPASEVLSETPCALLPSGRDLQEGWVAGYIGSCFDSQLDRTAARQMVSDVVTREMKNSDGMTDANLS